MFPGSMGHEEETQVKQIIISAFEKLGNEEKFKPLVLESLRPNERRMLFEKKLINQDFSLNKDKSLILNKDYSFSGMINTVDHLRMISLGSGLSLESLSKELLEIDSKLEEIIDFAVDLDWGYLSCDLGNLGTGMRTSLLVHLPALVKTGLIDKVLKAMLHADFQVTGFIGDSDSSWDSGDSLGQFYLVANSRTLGVSEEENRLQIEKLADQLINYERMARNDLLDNKIELEDRVFRARGLLENCRLLSYNESIELISSLRLGGILGLLNFSLEQLNSLLILGQPCHIQERLIEKEAKLDDQTVDRERADFFKSYLLSDSGV